MKFVSYFLLTYGILYDNNGITKQLAKQIVNAQSIVIFSLKYLLTKQISRVWSLGIFVLYGAQCFLRNRLLVLFASAINRLSRSTKNARLLFCASVFFILLLFLVILYAILHLFRKLENQFFGILPAEARIGNGFAVHAAVGRLRAFFDVGLDHQAFDDCTDVG